MLARTQTFCSKTIEIKMPLAETILPPLPMFSNGPQLLPSSIHLFKIRGAKTEAESRKHYGRAVIDRRKVGKTIEIWRKVCQNKDLKEGLDKYFNNKN